MPVQITVRNVPEEVRDALATRAAVRRQSMGEFLSGELERISAKPSIDNVLQEVHRRKETAGTRISPTEILAERDADRT
ncbi:MAG: hypothetical protein OXB92_10830 [Acidimicrobiaceae bacterium]|nr:hypothetical protein [Acidimicrobiia bacterium]MCY4494338.1 hypothetical protein [Acidimicrobiaceae bacterium]